MFSKEREISKKCEPLGKEFKNRNSLGGHTRTYHGKETFICDVCGKQLGANR